MPRERARRVDLSSLLGEVSRLMTAELIDRMEAAGHDHRSATHHPVFANIDPDGTRLTVLAERAGMTHQSMGELVASMERLGYLERRADPADGRARLVALTLKGRRIVRLALREIGDIEQAWLKRFRDAGLAADLRSALVTAVSTYESERDSPAVRS